MGCPTPVLAGIGQPFGRGTDDADAKNLASILMPLANTGKKPQRSDRGNNGLRETHWSAAEEPTALLERTVCQTGSPETPPRVQRAEALTAAERGAT